jgi:anti-sigma regulatory factor (Ser/Thr protein kinase)
VSAVSPERSDRPVPPHSLELQLQRDVRAPALARTAVSQQLAQLGIDGTVGQTAILLVSEVVSNAVRHSNGPAEAEITLTSTVDDGSLRVAVTDAGSGFTPRPRDPDKAGEGYGLHLLEKAARNWGVESDGATTVWFELDHPAG